MSTSRRIIARIDPPEGLTPVGWGATLYADGRVAIEHKSYWQGSLDGERWTTEPGHVDVAALDPADPDNDGEAALTHVIDTIADHQYGPEEMPVWRRTRRGSVVR